MAQFEWHPSNFVAFIRLNFFVKIDLKKWLDRPKEDPELIDNIENIQGALF
jgi:hypothetical protein